MHRFAKKILTIIFFFIAANGICFSVLADDHRHKGEKYHGIFSDDDDDSSHRQHRKHSKNYGKSDFPPVTNETYKENCGSCHFTYQPGLLPSGSWAKIMNQLDDHFGEAVEMDTASENNISDYLKNNAAEHSSSKRSVKIVKCLRNQTPLRITEIPYIIKKHDDISSGVFKRESVGSLSNCIACHKTADQGIYDDDDVNIPR